MNTDAGTDREGTGPLPDFWVQFLAYRYQPQVLTNILKTYLRRMLVHFRWFCYGLRTGRNVGAAGRGSKI